MLSTWGPLHMYIKVQSFSLNGYDPKASGGIKRLFLYHTDVDYYLKWSNLMSREVRSSSFHFLSVWPSAYTRTVSPSFVILLFDLSQNAEKRGDTWVYRYVDIVEGVSFNSYLGFISNLLGGAKMFCRIISYRFLSIVKFKWLKIGHLFKS